MYLLVAYLLLFTSHVVRSGEQTEHRDFQYNSVVDPQTGRYNFAYDTGNDNEIAHTMHMQYRDANGIVRGRYGYTDPRGKLRVVEYEAGPKGFVARGDVGPDQSLHDQTPDTPGPQLASYTQDESDLQLDPRPVQMSGWDPVENPMGQTTAYADSTIHQVGNDGLDGYSTTNATSGVGADVYVPVIDPYNERYPRISISEIENSAGRELESLSAQASDGENKSDMVQLVSPVAVPVTVNNIDVNPDEIRMAASNQAPVGRSADGDSSKTSSSADVDSSRSSRSAVPYSYRNYQRSNHDHAGEIAYPYRSVYIPSHGHYHYMRQPHDHDAERRYYVNRQTHDHDAERRYYVNRQTHDHDAERRRYYYPSRYTHNHDAEIARYYSTIHRQNNPHRRRIYYKDDHSQQPHEHYSDIYHNDANHRHSDVQLYATSQSIEVPPTAKPGEVKYVSSDKYHDKYYYWTD